MKKLYILSSELNAAKCNGEVEITFCESPDFNKEMEKIFRERAVVMLVDTNTSECIFAKVLGTYEICKDLADPVNGYFITVKFGTVTTA